MTGSALSARGLRHRRGGRLLLDDAGVEVLAGEALALTGPSGSGKTTLLSVLAGFEPPDAGEVSRAVDAAGTAVVLQAYGLVALLTAAENVAVPLLAPGRPSLPRREAAARALASLAAVGLADSGDRLVESLSGGQQQRVAIARALVVRPRLLLVDEPTAALDRENRERVLDLLIDDRAPGTTVVVATHDPAVIVRVDRVLRVGDGRVVPAEHRRS